MSTRFFSATQRQSAVLLGIGLLCGALGALAVIASGHAGPVVLGIGVFLAAAVLLGLSFPSQRPERRPSPQRVIASAGLLVLAWPVSFAAVLVGGLVVDQLTRALTSPEAYNSLLRSDAYVTAQFGAALLVGSVTGAVVASLAALALTGRWVARAAVGFVVAGLSTVVVTYGVYVTARTLNPSSFPDLRDQLFWGLMLPVGIGLYTVLFGYWVRKTEAADSP